MFFPSLSGGSTKTPAGGPVSSPSSPSAPGGGDASKATGGDITGRFDPTALERGAKALKDLDSSPNAARAFEVTKLQEMTKQKEILRDMEQIQQAKAQMLAERARIEGDERRKTATHQQEQERMTAQYKTQLEAEAYSKKLQDQQKQNEEWLAQQHQQFLRQEEIRKRNEKELLEMKRSQIQEEKAMERELVKMKIQEEAKGRILQERENVDVHLREMRARAAEDRKTRLEVVQTRLSSIASAMNAVLDDPTKRTALVVSLTGLALGVYGARVGTGVAGRYVEAKLGKPPLVRETSRRIWTKGWNWKSLWPWLKQPDFQEKIVLPRELSERLQWTTNSLLAARRNGTPFRHLLLHGNPGTGKTLFARTLARESGMDYAIMTGGDVGPLGKDAVNEVNRLFNWANHSKKGMILFVDEAEAFLRQGRGAVGGAMSEDVRNVLSAFLHHTGTESEKFCVILATNVKEILDRAVLDRVDEQFEFPLPELEERKKMLTMFFDQYIYRPTKKGRQMVVDKEIDDAFLDLVAKKTERFSGRQLAKLVIGMQAAVFGSGTNTLTRGLAETVLHWKLAHLREDIDVTSRDNRVRLLGEAARLKLENPDVAY